MQNEVGSSPVGASSVSGGSPNSASGSSVTGDIANQHTNSHDNLVQMGERSSFNFALAIAWVVALLSILATLYFWWLSVNTVDVVAEKQSKLESIEQQLKAPAMVRVEKDSNDFKSSVSILSKAKKDRFSITEFLPVFYSKVTNDVKITSFSLSSDGNLSVSGTTKNYRTTADLVLALRSWSVLSDVDLTSTSMSLGTEEGSKPEALFSISAKVTTVPAAANSSASLTTGSVAQPSTGGGV
ncbi:MAG: PilN domain-containing protein [Dehalococcoidales bacterium]|nr:PilN domain-containing protein [Dehalococcoidales bacterium]